MRNDNDKRTWADRVIDFITYVVPRNTIAKLIVVVVIVGSFALYSYGVGSTRESSIANSRLNAIKIIELKMIASERSANS